MGAVNLPRSGHHASRQFVHLLSFREAALKRRKLSEPAVAAWWVAQFLVYKIQLVVGWIAWEAAWLGDSHGRSLGDWLAEGPLSEPSVPVKHLLYDEALTLGTPHPANLMEELRVLPDLRD